MADFAVLKQDFMICRRQFLACGVLQAFSLCLAAIIRGMKLIQISDIFFDTIPVIIIPMLLQILLAYSIVRRQLRDKTMVFTLAAGVRPERVMSSKILFMLLGNLVLLAASMLLGCALQVYDLTGVWSRDTYILLNLGGMCLQVFTGGWCFLAACLKERRGESFYWAFGGGVLVFFYGVYLLYYLTPALSFLQFITVFSLFRQAAFAAGSPAMLLSSLFFAIAGTAFYLGGRHVFCGKSQK